MFYFCLIFSLNGLAEVVDLCNLTYSKIQLNYDLFIFYIKFLRTILLYILRIFSSAVPKKVIYGLT